ncbi:MAG: hypothetical protein KBA40_01155 [Candidatus Peribacteraceae bacterium]|nr:hypothetical protein [Candidatus Peribacteraceae bacterium]MBP9850100.1 hypothetical protein [Candidatus Peribacteraceae bacterium]
MSHNSPTSDPFDAAEIDEWTPHRSRNPDKALKLEQSIVRQLGGGAEIADVRTKILKRFRQSNVFDANGTYTDLQLRLGVQPKREKIPASSTEDNGEEQIKRSDDLMDSIDKTYGTFTTDQLRPSVQVA